MMKKMAVILCGLVILAGTVSARAEDDKTKIGERLTAAGMVVDEIMATPDKGIPSGILAGASCVVVIPSYKKGAFVVGAQYGQGVATCRTESGKWSAPVCVQLAGGSFGFQAGGQETDLVLIAMNQQGLQQMLKNKFKLGADAAASAGPVGRNAQAGTDWKLSAEFLSYSRSKGLFAGINLDGTVTVAEPGRYAHAVRCGCSVCPDSGWQAGDAGCGSSFRADGGQVLCCCQKSVGWLFSGYGWGG